MTETEDPKRAKLLIDNVAPTIEKSTTDKPAPQRANDLIENEEPM
jgi:hypothetical protein